MCWLIDVLPPSLVHDKCVTKERWAVWAVLLYTVCMKSSGPKWALSLIIIIIIIIIYVVIVPEKFNLFSSLFIRFVFWLTYAIIYEELTLM